MQHTHDTSLWPDQAILYAEGVARYGTPENFRLQWVENAEHIPPAFLPPSIVPSPASRLIDYSGIIEQGLADLVAWVEQGIAPPDRAYRSEEHTSELQSLMRISYAVFCLKNKKHQ